MADAAARGSNWGEDYGLLLVNSDRLPSVWGGVEVLLKRDPSWREHYVPEEIYKLVYEGKMQLWIVSDEGGFILVVLTEIRDYPKTSSLKIMWVGGLSGKNAKAALPFLGLIELWARRYNCTRIEMVCRPAFLRLLGQYDYELKGFYLEKDISNLWEM